MGDKRCDSCAYWKEYRNTPTVGDCHLWPTPQATDADHWCGQFVPRREDTTNNQNKEYGGGNGLISDESTEGS